MAKAKLKALILDMDGVIINNNDWHLHSWLEFASKLGIPLTAEEFPERVFGKTNEQILLTYFPDADTKQLREWSLEKEALYREMYAPHFALAEGLEALLQKATKANLKIAVASNAPLVNLDFALDLGKIRPFFQAILYADLVANPKPAPDIYLASAAHLGLLPADCAVIEDSPTGLQAAKAAGCLPIAIASTYPSEKLQQFTEQVFPDFEAIIGYLNL